METSMQTNLHDSMINEHLFDAFHCCYNEKMRSLKVIDSSMSDLFGDAALKKSHSLKNHPMMMLVCRNKKINKNYFAKHTRTPPNRTSQSLTTK